MYNFCRMKKLFFYLTVILFTFGLIGCDKDFEETNVNPVLPTSLDPGYLFSSAQLGSAVNTYDYQSQIVQQLIVIVGGAREGGNHNVAYDPNARSAFNNLYGGPVQLLTNVLEQTKNNTARSNLYHMARILRAYIFQVLVDTYGDVPYSEAGQAYISGLNLPKYEPAQDIYNDLLKELEEATKALDAGKAIERGDIFYKGNITQWKMLGNSLLLRVAMRLTKADQEKAKKYVLVATTAGNGGLVQSNTNNVSIAYNSTFSNPTAGFIQSADRFNIYLGQPFVDYLKSTADPRLRSIAVKYQFPANPIATAGMEDLNPLNQQGMPFGYDATTIATAPGFPGKIGAAYKYSQVNRRTLAKIEAPAFLLTAAQTQLLLAEAVQRGWIAGNAATLYNAGVKAHMDQMALYDVSAIISAASQDAYLAANAFTPAKALEQINTQYWIASFLDGAEAWANFRRSGFPVLTPNPYPAADPDVKGSFIRRLIYPAKEKSVNAVNYNAAVARMGADNLATRIFWDK